jgi:hypothetical protein
MGDQQRAALEQAGERQDGFDVDVRRRQRAEPPRVLVGPERDAGNDLFLGQRLHDRLVGAGCPVEDGAEAGQVERAAAGVDGPAGQRSRRVDDVAVPDVQRGARPNGAGRIERGRTGAEVQVPVGHVGIGREAGRRAEPRERIRETSALVLGAVGRGGERGVRQPERLGRRAARVLEVLPDDDVGPPGTRNLEEVRQHPASRPTDEQVLGDPRKALGSPQGRQPVDTGGAQRIST